VCVCVCVCDFVAFVLVKFYCAIQLANQFASWSATCWRPASEVDSVTEFGAIQLASSSLADLRPARELVVDLVSDLSIRLSKTGPNYLDM